MLTSEQIRMKAREIAFQAREEAVWKGFNRKCNEAEDCGDYEAVEHYLAKMSEQLDKNVDAAILRTPPAIQDALRVAVNEFFGHLCGII